MSVNLEPIPRVVDALVRFGARKVILFGSALDAPGRARDIDLAVEGIPPEHLLDADVAVMDSATPWAPGAERVLRVRVTPGRAGQFPINLRCTTKTLGIAPREQEAITAPAAGTHDQQGYPVEPRLVTVREAVRVTVWAWPSEPGLPVAVDAGPPFTSVRTFVWGKGDTHTVQAELVVGDYVFSHWSDNGAAAHQVSPTQDLDLVAVYRPTGVTFTAAADTYVMEKYPESSSQGTGTTVVYAWWRSEGERQDALFRFDLGAIPRHSTVTGADLVLTLFGSTSQPIALHQVASGWGETTSWATRPAYLTAPIASQEAPAQAERWLWAGDGLRSVVQAWVTNPDSNHGLALVPALGHESPVAIYTREEGLGERRPQLVVRYDPPHLGSLTIALGPDDARDAARWRLTSGPDTAWKRSGKVVVDLPLGDYGIEFLDVPGWTTPAAQTIAVGEGANTLAATYGFALQPPTNVAATDNLPDRVVVTWDLVPGATSYEVWRDGAALPGAVTESNRYEDADAPAGVWAAYTVKARNGAGTTPASAKARGRRLGPQAAVTRFNVQGRRDVDPAANLVLTFNRAVFGQSGSVEVRRLADDAAVVHIAVGAAAPAEPAPASGTISGLGTNVLSIDPDAELPVYTELYVWISPGTFADAYGNPFAGITDSAICRFSTWADFSPIYVKSDATGANRGRSWSDAFTDLQDALAVAGAPGTEVWVARGVYRPTTGTDRSISFELRKGITLRGGFDGTVDPPLVLPTAHGWVAGDAGGYVEAPEFRAGMGYWVRANGPALLAVGGSPAPAAVDLVEGWNLIGVADEAVPPADARIVGPCWWWDAAAGLYHALGPGEAFAPGRGYWVFATHSFALDFEP